MTLGLTRHRPGELPVEVTGFVGRQREVADLTGLLSEARLVTVTGPGGVGKTRVALRVAAEHGDACLVQLSGLRDADLLPDTVAMCLGLPETEVRSRLDAIIEHLRDRRLLLILDTCEHVLDACAMLADLLLRATTAVTVLATSRQPLDVPGEHTMSLSPMPTEAAIELFAQCACAVVPGFAVTTANSDDVRAVCAWLDGVPLAIELAAVRLRALSLGQLASRLEDRFRLLTGGRRAALAHHQTLRAATEWSYDLCTPGEQLLWARLSVFAGSFDVDATEQVCDGEPLARTDVLATLIGLVDKSVVLRDDDRYRLLDTIREFGAEKLAVSTDATRGRHIAHYLALARRLGKAGSASLDELGREQPNFRAALEYALTGPGRERDAARMTAALYTSWQRSGNLNEGRYWIAKVLDRFPGPSAERAWALIVDGYLAASQGESTAAVASLQAGISMADELGERRASVHGRLCLAMALSFGGRYDEAAAAAASAEQHLGAGADVGSFALLDAQLAYLDVLRGNAAEGIAHALRGLDRIGADPSVPWHRSYLHALVGLGHIMAGDYQQGTAALAIALEAKLAIGDTLGLAYPLDASAWIAAGQHRYRRAAWLLGATDTVWQLAGGRLGSNPRLEAMHARAEQAARTALGEEDYRALYVKGAGYPLDEVVRLAIGQADDLPAAGPGPGPGPGPDGGGNPGARPALTGREGEIAALVATGLSNREIAERLVISKRTVDAHIEHIYGKLGVCSRVQLTAWLRSAESSG
jgi:predicted ATPase/DNA-binding CsgD family transcriptional regulator